MLDKPSYFHLPLNNCCNLNQAGERFGSQISWSEPVLARKPIIVKAIARTTFDLNIWIADT